MLLGAAAAGAGCNDDITSLLEVDSVAVSPSAASIIPGESIVLTAAVLDAQGVSFSGPAVVWASSDETVATVSSDGTVRGVFTGFATITATAAGVSGSSAITVTGVPLLALDPATVEFTTTLGAGNPDPVLVTVTNAGEGELGDVTVGGVSYSGEAGWLSTSLNSDLTIGFRAFPSGLAAGTYSASVQVSATSAANSPMSVSVTLTVNP